MSNLVEVQEAEIKTVSTGTSALVLNPESFESIMRFADMMAKGRSTLPKHLHANASDCAAVIMQAMQWGMNPYAVAQKTHLVSGTLGYEAQLVNAVITSQAPTKDRLNYEWFGDWSQVLGKFKEGESKTKKDDDTGEPKKYRVPNWKMEDEKGLGVRVWATMKGEDEPRVLELLLVQARTRNSTLWADDPRQQLAYLATKRWSRLYCPDVILGVYTPDELDEVTIKDVGSGGTTRKPSGAIVTDTCPDEVVDKAIALVEAAQSTEEVRRIWVEQLAIIRPYNDLEAGNKLKAKVAGRGEYLKSLESTVIEGAAE